MIIRKVNEGAEPGVVTVHHDPANPGVIHCDPVKIDKKSLMEKVFSTVDTLKQDLNVCGANMKSGESSVRISAAKPVDGVVRGSTGELECSWRLCEGADRIETVAYKYFPKLGALRRKVNNGHWNTLLDHVTDFYVTYFPDANSILYRIELIKKEQIRGYIFLLNMANR